MVESQKGDLTQFKVCVIGESGVGKTCIVQRYVNDRFSENN